MLVAVAATLLRQDIVTFEWILVGGLLGAAIGAIAGGGRGAGRGAWSGTAIGAGLGVAQSLIARKGSDVVIPSGTSIELKLDSPLQLAGSPSTALTAPIAYNGYGQ